MGFQMSEVEFQTFLFFFVTPHPYFGKRLKFSRFLIMMPPLSKSLRDRFPDPVSHFEFCRWCGVVGGEGVHNYLLGLYKKITSQNEEDLKYCVCTLTMRPKFS